MGRGRKLAVSLSTMWGTRIRRPICKPGRGASPDTWSAGTLSWDCSGSSIVRNKSLLSHLGYGHLLQRPKPRQTVFRKQLKWYVTSEILKFVKWETLCFGFVTPLCYIEYIFSWEKRYMLIVEVATVRSWKKYGFLLQHSMLQ